LELESSCHGDLLDFPEEVVCGEIGPLFRILPDGILYLDVSFRPGTIP